MLFPLLFPPHCFIPAYHHIILDQYDHFMAPLTHTLMTLIAVISYYLFLAFYLFVCVYVLFVFVCVC